MRAGADFGQFMRRAFIVCLIVSAGALFAQIPDSERRQSVVLSNGKIELTVALSGATLASVALLEDPNRFDPYGDVGRALPGHFLCLDGSGVPSQEESRAGYSLRCEANRRRFEIIQSTKVGPLASITMATHLPPAQEFVTRAIRMVDNENVAYVDTEVENLSAVDLPVSWAEHATIGPPFLEPGKLIVDMPAGRCRVSAEEPGSVAGRLMPLQDFDWPMAPLRNGGTVSLLDVPVDASMDLAGCRVDPKRNYGYITAFRQDKRLLFGYVFRRREFPWLMNWMNYTGKAQAARGIEFSNRPLDVSHRETMDAHEMFGTPAHQWLPAKSKMRTRFLLFYTRVPDDFTAVADVELESGHLRIKNKTGPAIVLDARLPL